MTITERLILTLHEDLQPLCREHLAACALHGIQLCVTQGYRSSAEQAALYAKGRTAPGKIVTRAPPGYSWHEFRRAYDVAVLDAKGKATWPNDVALWKTIGGLGKSVGLEWGGDFRTITDRPHFQLTGGLTLTQARALRDAQAADTEPSPPPSESV